MPSNVYILGGDDGILYLTGAGPTWNGGAGDVWQSQAASPFRLSMNETTGGIWTPTAPPRVEVYDGGPPFRIGAARRARGYGNVTEQVGVHIKATTHDRATRLLQELRWKLAGGLTCREPILVIQPDGATHPTYHTILSATVQELPSFINQEARGDLLRAIITWTLAPFGGFTTPDPVVSAASVGNVGTGSPSNVLAFSSFIAGDLIYDGEPLNITVDGTGTGWSAPASRLMIAVVPQTNGRVYTANTSSLVTSSTVGALLATISSIPATQLYTNPGLRGRVLCRITSAGSNLEVQARVAIAGGDAFHQTPWVRANPGTSTAVMVDLGPIPHPLYNLPYTGSPTLTIYIHARSTNGSATAGSLAYVEWLSAYSVGETPSFIMAPVTIETFVAQTGRPCLPIPARVRTDRQFLPWRGRPPMLIANSYLYFMWRGSTGGGNGHITSEQALVTVTHAPLYETLRGAG